MRANELSDPMFLSTRWIYQNGWEMVDLCVLQLVPGGVHLCELQCSHMPQVACQLPIQRFKCLAMTTPGREAIHDHILCCVLRYICKRVPNDVADTARKSGL